MEKKKNRRIILVTGGARSGKSDFALSLGEPYPEKTFIATAVARDSEMQDRIRRHQETRKSEWKLVEEPAAVGAVLERESRCENVCVVDCVTLLLSNWFEEEGADGVQMRSRELCTILPSCDGCVILVTNEIGAGIVPLEERTRLFRDMQGFVNKRIAAAADEVYLLCCGLPVRIK